MRRIERKDVQNSQDLERERLAFSPVLGKDAWYACAWYSFWRVMTVHMFTPAGLWAMVTTPLAYDVAIKGLLTSGVADKGWWVIMGFGLHTVLAWLYLCERHQARNILDAVADWIRGHTPPKPAAGAQGAVVN